LSWIPTYAGITSLLSRPFPFPVIPAQAGIQTKKTQQVKENIGLEIIHKMHTIFSKKRRFA
jgi:hypothetical protein